MPLLLIFCLIQQNIWREWEREVVCEITCECPDAVLVVFDDPSHLFV